MGPSSRGQSQGKVAAEPNASASTRRNWEVWVPKRRPWFLYLTSLLFVAWLGLLVGLIYFG